MTISEFEIRRCEKVVSAFIEKRRPPDDLRNQVDLAFRVKNQSVEIFEIRPRWNDPEEKVEEAIAKATYVKKQNTWKVYWQRADLKWHLYEPAPEVKNLERFLEIVDADDYGCFFG